MSTEEVKAYYNFIKEVILEAGKIVAEGFYKNDKNVDVKGESEYDLVTAYDKKVEDMLIKKVKEKYPSHEIIGEESWPSEKKFELTNTPTWIIDPIDGTINYVKSIPIIGISVALSVNKEVVLGIVYNPISNQYFSALRGEGSYCNGKRIYSTKNEDLHKAVLCNETSLASIPFLHDRTIERLKKLTEFGVLGVRSLGSAAVSLCYIAKGSGDIYFTDGLKCWDVAAGVFILQEAGGCASGAKGEPYDMFARNIIAAGNHTLLEKIIKIIKECDQKTNASVKKLMPPEIKLTLPNN